MYLKTLEISGFKSFAHKTRLEFEPVMIAIVGPNGCGKSNISDAIRWALGEQSPKALRATKMEDCIFNGTDTHKPLGMAEVSITFADCENVLQTEYHEITVTRRVFRTGEGQYFINKTPCRLKDIQRLFMDTGIGTTSYSLMEQGRIDQILSARPEDRRIIFEEVSGITKFKIDKKEAIRKLEHTEANLLRLADVIREVKRQIGSLQRQAGKARRYKTLMDELRELDMVAIKKRLAAADKEILNIERQAADSSNAIHATQSETQQLEKKISELRNEISRIEHEMNSAAESGHQAQNELEHNREMIQVNTQRIAEYHTWSNRDSREMDENRKHLENNRGRLQELSQQIEKIREEKQCYENELNTSINHLTEQKNITDKARVKIQQLRDESIERESLLARLQNQSIETESRGRSNMIRREKLSAEKAQLARIAADYENRQSEISDTLKKLGERLEQHRSKLKEVENKNTERSEEKETLRNTISRLESHISARQAQIDLLAEQEKSADNIPRGARIILDKSTPLKVDREKIFGIISDNISVEEKYRIAVEVSLRTWLDTVIVSDSATAVTLITELASHNNASIRLLAIDAKPEDKPASRHHDKHSYLMEHVQCTESLLPVLYRLIGNVIVVDSIDSAPIPVPPDQAYVTTTGCFLGGNSYFELWSDDSREHNPLSRKHILADARNDHESTANKLSLETNRLANLSDEIAAGKISEAEARTIVEQRSRELAQKEGEDQIISSEAKEAKERLDTVSWELNNLFSEEESGDVDRNNINVQIAETRERRNVIVATITQENKDLEKLETGLSELNTKVSDGKAHLTALVHKIEHLTNQYEFAKTRTAELEAAVEGRSAGIMSYKASVEKLTEAIKTAENSLNSLEQKVVTFKTKTTELKKNREELCIQSEQTESGLTQKRSMLEQLFAQKSDMDVRCAESKVRRQNMIDRITSKYSVTLDQIMAEKDPESEGSDPDIETLETQITEIQTKIEAMGPVNLIAIEEHQELEERYTFLTEQEEDLVKAKEQLMEMIRKINRTTSEMFRETFEKVNDNFQIMFKRLFNGGSAKLVLVNEEDVLECGIEIIARPPGKKLQNISLLSGGERTLAAVALLFSIYLIKPSPFCLLDELDAALDDSNIGRFVKVLQDFVTNSQFVVITHSKQTIAAAKVLYGITMPEKGISEIVSMKFKDAEQIIA